MSIRDDEPHAGEKRRNNLVGTLYENKADSAAGSFTACQSLIACTSNRLKYLIDITDAVSRHELHSSLSL